MHITISSSLESHEFCGFSLVHQNAAAERISFLEFPILISYIAGVKFHKNLEELLTKWKRYVLIKLEETTEEKKRG